MRRAAAPLAAAFLALAVAGCGGGGAEPGAPQGATLVLDFTPNAVHTGIYVAKRRGYLREAGVELTIREPSASTDAPKLLESGRAEFAILDINDLILARQRGLDVVGIAAIVQRPLGAVIARDRDTVRAPADLEGATVGVTGVPSDDAVLNTVLAAGGLGPDSVHRETIGFNAVSALAGKRLDAATAFWNAEGVQLQRLGVPIREFRVDALGDGTYRFPELLLATSGQLLQDHRELACGVARGLQRGYRAFGANPEAGLDDLITETSGLDRNAQRAQLRALLAGRAFSGPAGGRFISTVSPDGIRSWARWALANRLVRNPSAVHDLVRAAVETGFERACSLAAGTERRARDRLGR